MARRNLSNMRSACRKINATENGPTKKNAREPKRQQFLRSAAIIAPHTMFLTPLIQPRTPLFYAE
ncbi:hypothetical protein, partial [Pantoea rodasii]|uniref:hypothetical protein n=1 Tax=Pantoea rodasii TaxID=1076549 RepID=UPI001B805FF6